MDSGSPYRGPVKDLTETYEQTPDPYGDGTDPSEISPARQWLMDNPGRWGLLRITPEAGRDRQRRIKANIRRFAGAEQRQMKDPESGHTYSYSRYPHPEGESLEDALARTPRLRPLGYPADLPKVEPVGFGWTAEELATACKEAREALFGDRRLTIQRR